MRVLFYRSPGNAAALELRRVVESVVPDRNKEIYERIEDLEQRLRRPPFDDIIGVFLTTDMIELATLQAIDHLLRNIYLILLLPDSQESTHTMGHRLYPRFLTDVEGDFREVAAVLSKMMKRFPLPEEMSYPGRIVAADQPMRHARKKIEPTGQR